MIALEQENLSRGEVMCDFFVLQWLYGHKLWLLNPAAGQVNINEIEVRTNSIFSRFS